MPWYALASPLQWLDGLILLKNFVIILAFASRKVSRNILVRSITGGIVSVIRFKNDK